MKKIIIIGVLLIVSIGSCNYLIPSFGDYSDGDRGGILQKFSRKGLFVKTWEGELAMEGIKSSLNANNSGSSISSIFEFSATDTSVIRQLTAAVEQKVKIHYEQKIHMNSFDGSTKYLITKVEIIK